MILTQDEFLQKFSAGNLKIAFVGMSNIGKSFRSKQLGKIKNFRVFSVDDAIEKKLGLSSMKEMAQWMGYPYEKKYKAAEKKYLAIEDDITRTVFPAGNFILDTTGSVIYTSPHTMDFLKKNYLIVELRCPTYLIDRMIESFFKTPKPVVWEKIYRKKPGETEKQALKRCYPLLLEDRNKRYAALADIHIDGKLSREYGISPQKFWDILLSTLPEKK